MNIHLFYIFQAVLLGLIVFAVTYAFFEATRPDSASRDAEDYEPAQD